MPSAPVKMAFVSVAFLAAAAVSTWPLADVQTVVSEGELLTSAGTQVVQQWYQFIAGPPHCDFRQRIDYPASKVIEIVDPIDDAISKVVFTNSSSAGHQCTTTGPAPFNETQCVNMFSAVGSVFNFKGTQPCPAHVSTSSCDLWTAATPFSEQSYLFASGTARVVQYSITTGTAAPSVITFGKFSVNDSIPASAWQIPSSWKPCTPGREHPMKAV